MRTLLLCILLISSKGAAAQPWESSLRGLSQDAQARVRELCQTEAKEEVFETAEERHGIYWKVVAGQAAAQVEIDGHSSGISYSSPQWQYLRLGLKVVEFSSTEPTAAQFQKMEKLRPIARFDTWTKNLSYVDSQSADVEVSYEERGRPEDRQLGIHGRTIRVKDLRTGRTLGERTEFFWLTGSVRQQGALCPSLLWAERTPATFIGKVVNPVSYPCMRQFEIERGMEVNRYNPSVINKLIEKLTQCEVTYRRRPPAAPELER